MNAPAKKRIESVDLLKGLVMVIMALDHTRDYLHFSVHYFNPIDPEKSTWPIYLTRLITDYCAPTFSFLAGLSAFFVGRRKSIGELSGFLFKRGIWLVLIELIIVDFGWYFNIHFNNIDVAVIWTLGISMIVLGALVYLPRKLILIFSLILIFGHNLLDNLHYNGNIFWAIIHESHSFALSSGFVFTVEYPIIPWIGVMALGYCFGPLYDAAYDGAKRRRFLNLAAISIIGLFILIRWINIYGDPVSWKDYGELSKTLMSFLNVNKYPPSLCYLLMTLGPALLFLANSEKLKSRIVSFFSVFGRVPFFYYIIHLYFIHIIAMIFAQLTGFGWQVMILHHWIAEEPKLIGYGASLWVVYMVWIGLVLALYPLCKRFDRYKQTHREKWWLSYL
jgi:uncharacterized membrane protein